MEGVLELLYATKKDNFLRVSSLFRNDNNLDDLFSQNLT